MGSATVAGAAAPARLRGTRAGSLDRTSRTVPAGGGRHQHARGQLHHSGAVLPSAPPASRTTERRSAAAHLVDPEEPAATSGGGVHAAGAGGGQVPLGDRRRDVRGTDVLGVAARPLQWQGGGGSA